MRPIWLILGLILTLPVSSLAADQAVRPDPAVQRSGQRVVLEFSRARRNPAKRAALVEKAHQLGGDTPQRLLDLLNKELEPQLRGYRERVGKAATTVERNRASKIDADEVTALRTAVLDLGKNPDLTKEMIVATADPALVKLAAMLLPDREAVLGSLPALAKQRGALLEIGPLWDLCAMAAANVDPDGSKSEPPKFASLLRGEEDLAIFLAAPLDPQTRQALTTNAQLAGKLDPEEANCIAAVNMVRNLLGLPALIIDPALCETARDHSHDMETKHFFAHESPVEGKTRFTDRAKRFGTTASGENIAMGVAQGSAANEMWFHSPGHHRNMLADHKRIGVGRSGVHWTELFGR